MSVWFVKIGDDILGPMGPDGLRDLAKKGRMSASTLLRRGRAGPWVAAGKVKGLLGPKRAEDDEASEVFAFQDAEDEPAAGVAEPADDVTEPAETWRPTEASAEVDDPRDSAAPGCLITLAVVAVIALLAVAGHPALEGKGGLKLMLAVATVVAFTGLSVVTYILRVQMRPPLVVSLSQRTKDGEKSGWSLQVNAKQLGLFEKPLTAVPVTEASWIEVVSEGNHAALIVSAPFVVQVVTPGQNSTVTLGIAGRSGPLETFARAVSDELNIPFLDLRSELDESFKTKGAVLNLTGATFTVKSKGHRRFLVIQQDRDKNGSGRAWIDLRQHSRIRVSGQELNYNTSWFVELYHPSILSREEGKREAAVDRGQMLQFKHEEDARRLRGLLLAHGGVKPLPADA